MGRWEPSQRSFRHCASASCLSLLMAMFFFLLSGHGNCLALEANENRNNNILMAQQQAARPGGPIPNDTRQLVLVITKDWNSVDGILRTFERRPGSDTWEQAGAPFPIVVGNRGLGWGLGLHGAIDDSGPKKVEGDKKAPAGVFRLTRAFGYDALETLGISGFPYQQVTANWKCIDDPVSVYYNQLLDQRLVDTVDWNSHEEMKRTDDLYQLGVVVAHNASPVVPGAGSCIFLHLWRDNGKGTSGCTAMARNNMMTLLKWLDGGAKPVLVQLPQGAYKRLNEDWKLPSVK